MRHKLCRQLSLTAIFQKYKNKFVADNQRLNIVDECGNIIGEETRGNIHKQGLLHKEVHVWLYTPKGEIIFQHRAKNKDTYPDLLDATVGGHVEIGSDYEDSAIKEMEEEAGIIATKDDLVFIKTAKRESHDKATGTINYAIKTTYAYCYNGKVEDLRVEKDEAIRFEAWSFEKVFNLSANDKKRFIADIFGDGTLDIFKEIQKLVK